MLELDRKRRSHSYAFMVFVLALTYVSFEMIGQSVAKNF